MTAELEPAPPCGGDRLEAGLRILSGAASALNAVGTLVIFALMVLVNADILGRELFLAPVRGTTELLALAIVGIVFLQLAHTLLRGRLTRSDAMLGLVRRRRPALGAILEGVFHLFGAGMLAILVWASTPYFLRAWEIDEYVGSLGDFTAPTWPVRLIILVGGGLTALIFLALALRQFRDVVRIFGRATS